MMIVFAYPSLERADPGEWERFCRFEIPYPLTLSSPLETVGQGTDRPSTATEARVLVIHFDDQPGGQSGAHPCGVVEPVSIPLDAERYAVQTELLLPSFQTGQNVIDLREILARRYLKRRFEWLPEPALVEEAVMRSLVAAEALRTIDPARARAPID